MFHEGAINLVLRSIHVAIVMNTRQCGRERKRLKKQSRIDSQATNQ